MIHGELDLTNLIMFGEAIKVKDIENEGLGNNFVVGDLEGEAFIEDRIEGLSMNFGLLLGLLVGKKIDFAVWITSSSSITCRKILRLNDSYRQLNNVGRSKIRKNNYSSEKEES